jgi:tetratricopeptide (TPR) repeat protein
MLNFLLVVAALVAGFVVWRKLREGSASADASPADGKGEPPPSAPAKSASGHTGRLSPDPAANAAASTPAAPPTPLELAEQAERKFRKALAAEAGDLAPSALLRTLAEKAAHAFSELEDTRRAAEIYRDARIHDKALKLYVNTLKDYPEAAQVASRKGDHALSAKLYTYVGDKEKALTSWVEWGRKAANPLQHAKEMRALGEEHFANVLVSIIETRPATNKDAELLYRLGGALDAGGFPSAALRVFARLVQVVPNYKDVAELRVELEQRVEAEARAQRMPEAESGSQFEAVTLPTVSGPVAHDSDPPFALLELPHIDDNNEAEALAAEASADAPDASQTESLVKTALATLALVTTAKRVRKGVVEEQVARTSHDDR